MSVIDVEVWTIAEGVAKDEHDAMIRSWFEYVAKHHDEMFQEWKSVRYYRDLDRATRRPTGRYIMMFEFHDIAGRDAYKERRKDWDGPYAEYKQVDPYQFFDEDKVVIDMWEPLETELWLDWAATGSSHTE